MVWGDFALKKVFTDLFISKDIRGNCIVYLTKENFVLEVD